jgi:hypothetical protein
MSNTETSGFEPYEHGNLDESDDYVLIKQRQLRTRIVIGLIVVVLGGGGWLYAHFSAQRATAELVLSSEAKLLRGDFGSLNAAAKEILQVIADDERAPGHLLVLDAQAELLLYSLYTDQYSQLAHARELIETAEQRAPDEPRTLVGRALAEAIAGSPDLAIAAADAGFEGIEPSWGRIVRAQAEHRKGRFPEAAAALDGCKAPLCMAWAARSAWLAGDVEGAAAAASKLSTGAPGHEVARAIIGLATARRSTDAEATSELRALLEQGEPLPSPLSALVSVDLARLLSRTSGPKRAEKFLTAALTADEASPILAAEFARMRRFQGSFGAAKIRADKALRSRSAEPTLLGEMAAAAFFNDDSTFIRDRVSRVPKGAEESDGVKRALAFADLVDGSPGNALPALLSTRHLAAPGETDLWVAWTKLKLRDFEGAAAAATAAREAFAANMGEGTPEVASAALLEAQALILGGVEGGAEAAQELLDSHYADAGITPWTAWLYGQVHEARENPRGAKDAYLLACHNGQDFALSCLDLARIYDVLSPDALGRRTQKEARRHYLRTAPKGRHAGEIRAMLKD